MAHCATTCFTIAAAWTMGGVVLGGKLPQPDIPHGCGVQLKNHNWDRAHLEQARKLAFRVVRKGVYWNSVEKAKGEYTFDEYDRLMADAKELGLTVIACLFGGNKLYEDDGEGGIQTEAGRKGFAAFAAAAAKRYKARDVLWEIWNEPNVRTFWRKSGKHNSPQFAREYTDLVKAVAPAMLAADANCFIVAGSVSNYWQPSYEWMESCFREGILKTGIRGWSVHPYGVKTPEEFAVGHARTRKLLKKYGSPDLPILNTERGFGVKETGEGFSGGSKQRAREFQAWNFVRQFMIDRMNGIAVTCWYELSGEAFGILDEDGSRPVRQACKAMFAQLDGYRYVRRIESDAKLDYVLVFRNEAGDTKLVAWTAPPPGGAPDEARNHIVAIDTNRSFGVTDLAGKRQKVSAVLQLVLTGAPQYAAIPPDVQMGKCRAVALSAAPPTTAAKRGPPPAVAGAVDLKLFVPGTQWKFMKNTGQGSFTLGVDDDLAIGTMEYDFTKSRSKSTPYVLAATPVTIGAGATAVQISARSKIAQQLTFRLVDSTGQTHQFKKRIKGTGGWETITIPLGRRLEHWDGAADGKKHFPLKSIVFSVPRPNAENLTGNVEYAKVLAVGGGAAAVSTTAPETAPAAPATSSGDLKLFEGDTKWEFMKNTGEGRFTVAKEAEGKAIGVMEYDFTKSKSRSTPYVLAKAPVMIGEAATAVQISARSKIAQQLTFRLVDSTGQTHQFKKRIKGTGGWETITIPLTRRLEHWGGAADGKKHFPLKSIVFSVPRPNAENLSGKVEYANVTVVGAP